MAQIAKLERYDDGNVVLSNLRNNIGAPVFAPNSTISASRVTEWWDGTPMTDAKVDGEVYFKLKKIPFGSDTSLNQYVGDYFKVDLPNEGELFLEKDTMQEMRDLNSTEILLLQMGYYKGVRLNGYYQEGDTPAPINYIISTTIEEDDGGSIIEVGGIKLEHDFKNIIHISYFGGRGDFEDINTPYTDNTDVINTALNKLPKGQLVFSKGAYAHDGTINIPTHDSNNSRGISFKSDSGRLEAGGTVDHPQGGTVRLCFSGQNDTAAIRSTALQTWVDFSNLSIRNVSGRSDVDGLVLRDFKGNLVENLYIGLFRDNLVVNGESYYTVFSRCTFSHAVRNGVYMNGLVNLGTFRDCRFRLSGEYGIRVEYGGDGVNILDSFIEGNLKGGLYATNTRLVNLHNTYVEHNGTVEGPLGGRFAQIYIGAYGYSNYTPVIANIKGNYILGGNRVDIVNMTSSTNPSLGKVTINLEDNTIPAQHVAGTINGPAEERTYVVRGQSTSLLNVRLKNNKYSYVDADKMYFPSNYRPDQMNSFYSDGDESVLMLRPEYDKAFFDNSSGSAVKSSNIHFYRAGTSWNGSNKDSQTIVRYDAPDLETASLDIRHLSETDTTGTAIEKWYNPETKEIIAELDYKTGRFRSKEIRVGLESDNIRIFTGTALPNGVYSGGVGSIYLHTGSQNAVRGFYYKTTDNTLNTGWELVNPMRRATASPDSSISVGETYSQSEVQAILNELRDLKAKMRSAGLMNE